MLHQGQEMTQATNLGRWKSERGGLLRNRRPYVVGRCFEEDLALFGRQVREETGERNGPPVVPISPAAPSA